MEIRWIFALMVIYISSVISDDENDNGWASSWEEHEHHHKSKRPTRQPTRSPSSAPSSIPTSTPTAQPTSTPTAQPTSTPTAQPTHYITHITTTFTIYDAASVGNYSFFLVETPLGPQIRVTDCGRSQTCANPETAVPVDGISDKLNRTLSYFSLAIDSNQICLYGSNHFLYYLEGTFQANGANYSFNSNYNFFNQSKYSFPGVTSLAFLSGGNVTIGINQTLSSGLPPWISASPRALFSV